MIGDLAFKKYFRSHRADSPFQMCRTQKNELILRNIEEDDIGSLTSTRSWVTITNKHKI